MNMTRTLPWCLVLCLALATQAMAAVPVPAAPSLNAKGYILMDYHTGNILAEDDANDRLDPASLTKLMTAYVVFSELAAGKIGLEDEVTVSEKAWRTPGSRMFIEVGKQVRLEDLLQGMIVQSGNDASVALAEHVAGTEQTFADLMNHFAGQLGMTGTQFRNSTGLPAKEHYTTAHDMALLARAIVRDFPQFYHWYSQRQFTFNEITQSNRNVLLWRDESIDGLKTGMTDAAGYCLVSSAKRGSMRLISVVMGTPSAKVRADASQALLNYGFRFFESLRLFEAQTPITTVRVWKGAADKTSLGLEKDLYVTVPRGERDKLEAAMDLQTTVIAPVSTDQELGRVRVTLEDNLVADQALVALVPVETGSFFDRALDEIRLWLE